MRISWHLLVGSFAQLSSHLGVFSVLTVPEALTSRRRDLKWCCRLGFCTFLHMEPVDSWPEGWSDSESLENVGPAPGPDPEGRPRAGS